MAEVLHIAIGALLLVTGRRLFWFFVGSLGFVAGMQWAQFYWGAEPMWMTWAAALVFGIIGALLALFFQTLAIGIAGGIAGGVIVAYVLELAGFEATPMLCLIGGIAGMILLYITFDWALIGLSAVAGATLIMQSVHVNQQIAMIMYAVLIAVGIVFQAAMLGSNSSAMR